MNIYNIKALPITFEDTIYCVCKVPVNHPTSTYIQELSFNKTNNHRVTVVVTTGTLYAANNNKGNVKDQGCDHQEEPNNNKTQ